MQIVRFFAPLLSATLLTSVSWAISSTNSASAQSITPAADGTGTVITTPDGQTYNITGGTLSGDGANLFQSFEQLNLESGEVANFLANPQVQNILGRIVGGDPSMINGLIQVMGGNSNLYLVNPAGIVFGSDAQLNVPASFSATTADRIGFGDRIFNATGNNNYETLIGNPSSYTFTNPNPGSIVNLGNLAVNENQNLSLVAGSVVNTGTLSAPGGNITIAAVPGSNRVQISQKGMILNLEPVNPGMGANGITPASLPELLTGGTESSANTVQVNDDGSILLTQSNTTVPSGPGVAITSGTLNTASSQTGGNIAVLGDRVGLINAQIDASGQLGGGNIFIGGEYQGGGELPTASQTYIDSNSTLNADAVTSGDGGQVIVWADLTTSFFGNISAQGGENSGDGGFVEVSGKDTLVYQGQTDTSATNGEFGTLLLDPKNIAVVGSTADGDDEAELENALGSDPDASSYTVLASQPPTGGTFTIYESELEGMSGDTNIELQATNNISINDLPDDELLFAPGSGTITFTADADDSGSGSFIMNGSSDVIRAEGRDLNISGAAITVATLDTSSDDEAGNINLTSSGGDIKVNGGLNTNSVDSEGGAINLDVTSGLGAINISSSGVTVSATSENGEGGNVTFNTAGGNITTLDVQTFTNGEGTAGDIDFNIAANSEGTGQIDTSSGTIDASSATGEGGKVTFTTAAGNIDTANVNTSSGGDEDAGEIKLNIDGGIGSIDTTSGTLNSTSVGGDGGEVKLTTNEGNISSSTIDSSSDGGEGGEVKLDVAAGTGSINATTGAIDSRATVGNGGNVELRTFQGTISTTDINSSTTDADARGGQIEIQIQDVEGSIDTTAGVLTSGGTAGDGGKIELTTVDGNIQTGDIDASAIEAGNGGEILLEAGGIGSIDITAGLLNSSSVDGNAGPIDLNTDEGDIQIQNLDASSSGTGNGGNISATAEENLGQISASGTIDASAANGNGGSVTLETNEGNIDTAEVNTSSDGTGDGGNITATINNGLGSIDTTSGAYDATSVGGNGGTIDLNTNQGGISVSDLSSFSEADGFTGGNISLTVDGQEGSINTTSGTLASGTSLGAGGDISLSTVDGNISTSDVLANSTGSEIGGNIDMSISEGFGSIDTSNGVVDAGSGSLDGGDISLSVADGNINTSSLLADSEGSGLGGNITVTGNEPTKIDTSASAPDGSASIIDVSSETGTGGDVKLEAGFVVTTSTDASGGTAGGNITYFGDEVDIIDGSAIQSNGGVLQFGTYSLDQDIVVGATSSQGGSFLDIVDSEIDFLVDGFSEIEIGRADGTGTIYVVSPEFQDPAVYLQPTEDGLPE